MKVIKNKKRIDPRYFLNETAISEKVKGGGGAHGAWVEADAECGKKGGRNSQEYKDCMESTLDSAQVDEAVYGKHRGAGPESGTTWIDDETGEVVGHSGPGEEKMHKALPGGSVSPKFDARSFSDEVGLAVNALGGDEVLRIVQGVIGSIEV